MKRALVAGATGYLGGYIVDELKRRGMWVRALVRRPEQRKLLEHRVDDIVIGQVTDAETLRGVAKNIDSCFSTVGITTQRDGLTYEDVDFKGNLNLLREATASGVGTFVYVSVLHGRSMRGTKLVEAKERFVDASRRRHCRTASFARACGTCRCGPRAPRSQRFGRWRPFNYMVRSNSF
jgi:uncharacterized protein YbjT (DUF2867 family)